MARDIDPHEAELREHRRQLADGQHMQLSQAQLRALLSEAIEQTGLAYQFGEPVWQEGTCTGCGMSDEPVIGPAGAELCRFCDQLRILPPAPPAPAPVRPQLTPAQRHRHHRQLVTTAMFLAGWVCLALFGGQVGTGIAVVLLFMAFAL